MSLNVQLLFNVCGSTAASVRIVLCWIDTWYIFYSLTFCWCFLKSCCRNGFFVETFSNFLAKSEIDILRRYRRSLWKFATLHFRFFSIYSKFCISCWSIYKVDISVFVSVRAYFYDTAIPPYSVVINVFLKKLFISYAQHIYIHNFDLHRMAYS